MLYVKNETLFRFAELSVANTLPSVLVYVAHRAKTARLAGTCRQEK